MAGIAIVKSMTILCNFFFAAAGVLIFSVGAMVQYKYWHFSNFIAENIWTAPFVMMCMGLALTVIYCMGCCGLITENSCLILCFVISAIVLFALEVALGFTGYTKHTELKLSMEKQFNATFVHYQNRQDYRDAWTLLQSELTCCGIMSAKDWEDTFENKTLPASCCTVINLNEAKDCTVMHAHHDGCLKKLRLIIDDNTMLLVGLVLGVALIQLIIVCFACCLFRSF